MANLTSKEIDDLAYQIKQALLKDIAEELYINLEPGQVQLDDWYTPSQLRRIANAIEELDRRVKALEQQPKPGPSETK